MFIVVMIGHLNDSHENEVCYLYFIRIFTNCEEVRERQKAFVERVRECEEMKEDEKNEEKEIVGNRWRKKWRGRNIPNG